MHHKFRVAHYSQLPRTKLAEAILYVTSMKLETVADKTAEEYLAHWQYAELKHLVECIGGEFHQKDQVQYHAWDTVRKLLPVEAAAKIPTDLYWEAQTILKRIEEASFAFKCAVMEIEKKFFRQGFGELPLDFHALKKKFLK